MVEFLKLIAKGLLYLLLIPLGIVGFTVYGVFLFIMWIIELFKAFIRVLKHKPAGMKLQDDYFAEAVLENARKMPKEESQQSTQPQQSITYNIHVNGNIPGFDPNALNQMANNNIGHSKVERISTQDIKELDYTKKDEDQ